MAKPQRKSKVSFENGPPAREAFFVLVGCEMNPDNKEREAGSLLIFLETKIWPRIPADVLGTTVSKEEIEEILGYGPFGV